MFIGGIILALLMPVLGFFMFWHARVSYGLETVLMASMFLVPISQIVAGLAGITYSEQRNHARVCFVAALLALASSALLLGVSLIGRAGGGAFFALLTGLLRQYIAWPHMRFWNQAAKHGLQQSSSCSCRS